MSKKAIETRRDFPAVEELLQSKKLKKDIDLIPKPLASEIVKRVIAEKKKGFESKKIYLSDIENAIIADIRFFKRKQITKVINATGIVIHTNLGRAPLSETLFEAIKKTVVGYGNVEFDLHKGSRGKRGEACEKYLSILSGAESSTVVNNCAAALFVILNSLSNRKEVIISRSELVQIGGGFRIPDILKRSGAKLAEIGSTNITSITDYEKAVSEKTGMILKVHQSNFVQKGFVENPTLSDLVKIGKKMNLPVINDLGSGVFIKTKPILGYSEPTVQESVRAGADLTCFSGDKMLGGGQAGLIVGKKELVAKVKKNPIFRAFRVDKIVFSMLETLLELYLSDRWQDEIKLWQVMSQKESDLYKRAKAILKNLGNPKGVAVEATNGYIGGGALPEAHIPSVGITFSEEYNPNKMMKMFRELPYPIIGRIDSDRFILDLKAVDLDDYPYFEKSIKEILDAVC